jgi:hypothetical protein
MTEDVTWDLPLKILASALPKKSDQGMRNVLCFASSEEAQSHLPGGLRERQAPESSVLGERRMRSHTLALLALHRARMLLGTDPKGNKLRLFISHAKADGLFLADSVRSLIDKVPELEKWYDADALPSGENWSDEIEAAASTSVFLAIRTEGYEQSSVCRREFETALTYGVPIIVVDALLRPTITASTLPFAAMPTVRIPDGNIHRVILAALREHLRILLVETFVSDQMPKGPGSQWRVWPRLPTLGAIQRRAAIVNDREFWLIPSTFQATIEFNAIRNWLITEQSLLALDFVDNFVLFGTAVGLPEGPEQGAP